MFALIGTIRHTHTYEQKCVRKQCIDVATNTLTYTLHRMYTTPRVHCKHVFLRSWIKPCQRWVKGGRCTGEREIEWNCIDTHDMVLRRGKENYCGIEFDQGSELEDTLNAERYTLLMMFNRMGFIHFIHHFLYKYYLTNDIFKDKVTCFVLWIFIIKI